MDLAFLTFCMKSSTCFCTWSLTSLVFASFSSYEPVKPAGSSKDQENLTLKPGNKGHLWALAASQTVIT